MKNPLIYCNTIHSQFPIHLALEQYYCNLIR
nr:MAG TPA: hypothetical protein [Caudoviricetes sp.]